MEIHISLELHCHEDVCLYFGLEEPYHDLVFRLTPVGCDKWGNVLSYRMNSVGIAEVIMDRGHHFDMTPKEIREYKELL